MADLSTILEHGALIGAAPPPQLKDFYNYLPDAQPTGKGQFTTTLGNEFHDASQVQDLLKRVQFYDPSASVQLTPGHDNGEGHTGDQYQVVFDRNKMPRPAGYDPKMAQQDIRTAGGTVGNTGNYDGWNSFRQTDTAKTGLYNPDKKWQDSTYGELTTPGNAKPQGFDWLDLGPLFVLAAAGGIGAFAGAAGLGAGAAGAGEFTASQAYGMANAVPGVGNAINNQDPLGAIMALTGPVGSAIGVPSLATTLLRAGIGAVKSPGGG